MIEVVYQRNFNKITIEGHAYSGEKGHDLVCASASTLAYTLAAAVSNIEAQGALKSHSIEIEDGNASIKCRPHTNFKSTVMLIFDNICGGFELLSKSYPQNISYKIL